MRDLNGKVAWITGAGTGIGAAGAEKLAQAGCKVILSGRRAEPLEACAADIVAAGGEASVELLDVLYIRQQLRMSSSVHQVTQLLSLWYRCTWGSNKPTNCSMDHIGGCLSWVGAAHQPSRRPSSA